MYAYAPRTTLAPLRIRRPIAPWRVWTRRLVMLAAVFLLTVIVTAEAVHGQQPGGYQSVTVRPGDTVWSIASERYPGADTREKVDQILRTNGLRTPTLFPGEQLRVPAS